LAWPQRIDSGVANLNLFEIARLDFEKPDMQAFPSLAIARAAAQAGANAATIMNAANEIAVQAFLERRIGFTQIAEIVEQTLNNQILCEPESLQAVQESDHEARLYSSAYIKSLEK
jgi:1-deoxy-D-xylulose-5-phosphate reductoisomerase